VIRPLTFDRGGTSWERADPRGALIEPVSECAWRVLLPDAEEGEHVVVLARDHDGYRGRCDCPGFEYNDGPCAHLATVRQADFGRIEDIGGEIVDVPAIDAVEDEHALSQASGPERGVAR
jgi:hypothetical protein